MDKLIAHLKVMRAYYDKEKYSDSSYYWIGNFEGKLEILDYILDWIEENKLS